jgi:hypothetical protein
MKFTEHLDQCERCRNHPFNLCSNGARLLQQEVDNVGRLQQDRKKQQKPWTQI